jgi:amidase
MIGVTVVSIAREAAAQDFVIEETTVAGIQQALQTNVRTGRQIVQAYFDRIAAYDRKGPALNSILTLNPKALAEADRLDAERTTGAPVGPLHCVPLVLKDNYNTADLPTTGGSASLAGMLPPADAFVVVRLRKAGAIILGKSNMHEFALSGTTVSSLGGQTLNPYDLTRTPGGSSGGTGTAVAANLALAGTGSDTVNSIRSPASANALVGIRPTKGLVSRAGIMPVSETQDAIGPIARTVADAARLLEVMAGYDQNDPSTASSIGNTPVGYVQFLKPGGLRGARIGLLKTLLGSGPEHQEVNSVIAAAMAILKIAGAELVEVDAPALDTGRLITDNDVQKYEFKALLNAYLAAISDAPAKSLAEIIASGRFHKPSLEKFLSSAESFAHGMEEPDYKERLLRNQRIRQLLSSAFAEHKLDALVYPLQKRLTVPLTESNQTDRNGILASVTGFPAITVPAGFSPPTATAPLGVPVGMDILGKPWSEGRLIELACGFEQEIHVRKPPSSAPALPRR